MHSKTIERYFFLGFLVLVTVFVFLLFKPFLAVLILGASLAVVLHPLYIGIKHKITRGSSWAAALISVFLFVVVLCGPLFVIGTVVFEQSQDLYTSVLHGGGAPFIQSVGDSINNILPPELSFNIQEKVTELVAFVTANIATVFTATLNTIFSIFLIILAIFYFLKDGDHWRKSLILLSPLSDADDEKIIHKLSTAINGVIKGYVIIGLAQGILMGVGMAIFGIPTPALWAVLSAFASLVPTVGTGLVAVPAVIYLVATGHTGQAVGMAIWAAGIVGMIDNLLNPIVVGQNAQLPPLLVLFSVLGGIALMGPVGILVGPLAISLLYALVSIYRNSFQGVHS